MKLQKRAEALATRMFVGGPVEVFEDVGRLVLITLLREGLEPGSKVLDVGCGCLRAGYWLIHFLDPDCYFGIEPNRQMLDMGINEILEPGLRDEKRPQFRNNDDFDFSSFGQQFDFVVARSIWTHASKAQVGLMLDSFVRSSAPTGVFITSYLRAGLLKHRDFSGDDWIGRSHKSTVGGLAYHNLRWIQRQCRERGLIVRELRDGVFQRQIWLRISHAHV